MKLRWKIQYEKIGEEFNHTSPGWRGVKDGGYRQEPTREKVLQFFNEENQLWEDVPIEY